MSVTGGRGGPRGEVDGNDNQKISVGYARKILELVGAVFSDTLDLICNPDSFLILLDIKENGANVLSVLKEKIPGYLREGILNERDLKKALSSYIRAKCLKMVKSLHSKYSENGKLHSDGLFRDRNGNIIGSISEKDSKLLAFCLLNRYVSDYYMVYVVDIFADHGNMSAFVKINRDGNILDEMYENLLG